MQILKRTGVFAWILLALCAIIDAASWAFDDATLAVQGKKTGSGEPRKEKLVANKPLSKPIVLGSSDSLKILLTAKEDKKAKRPHQAFLAIKDVETGLDTSFVFSVRENGKAKLDVASKDIPTQLLSSPKPLRASLIIASFGSAKPYNGHVFDLSVDAEAGLPSSEQKPMRYGKLPEIHHIFKTDPKSPPKIITLVFTAAIVAALPLLVITWLSLGANLYHLSKAFESSPIPHSLFFLSIIAVEGIFFMYYTSWNLFQMLPAVAGTGLITFLSGSRALREVQERRLMGLR